MGDAAHLVPNHLRRARGEEQFGPDDAGNPWPWKLATRDSRRGCNSLLDSYSSERVHAAARTSATAPRAPSSWRRQTTASALCANRSVTTALENERCALVNPRQTTAIEYVDSPAAQRRQLLAASPAMTVGQHAGLPAPRGKEHRIYSDCQRRAASERTVRPAIRGACFGDATAGRREPLPGAGLPCSRHRGHGDGDIHDTLGQMRQRYAAATGVLYVIRPDGYVLGRWRDGRDIDIAAIIDKRIAADYGPT